MKHFLPYYSISFKTKTKKKYSAPDSKPSPVSILPLARQSFTPKYTKEQGYNFFFFGGGGHCSGFWKESEDLTMF